MNYIHTTTTADALALHIVDITTPALLVEIEAAEPSTEGASMADAMATIGTLELTGAEWASHI